MPVTDEMQISSVLFPDFTPLQQAVGLEVVPTTPVQQGRGCCFDDDDVSAMELRKKLPARLFVISLRLSEAEHYRESQVSN
jgi:hypothetical protein